MRNLVSIAPRHVLRHISDEDYIDHAGLLRSPRNASHIATAIERGAVFACDNDVFVGYVPRRIEKFLAKYKRFAPFCVFFNAPDVLLSASGTLERFWHWLPILKRQGWPVAFTLQNGMENYQIPWDHINAVFVGGDDLWRYGTQTRYVQSVIDEANRRGLWSHVGRVSTIKHIRYWHNIGASSFDSSGYTIEPAKVKRHLPYHSQNKQPSLFDLAHVEYKTQGNQVA
jgi:hypothetical protein